MQADTDWRTYPGCWRVQVVAPSRLALATSCELSKSPTSIPAQNSAPSNSTAPTSPLSIVVLSFQVHTRSGTLLCPNPVRQVVCSGSGADPDACYLSKSSTKRDVLQQWAPLDKLDLGCARVELHLAGLRDLGDGLLRLQGGVLADQGTEELLHL